MKFHLSSLATIAIAAASTLTTVYLQVMGIGENVYFNPIYGSGTTVNASPLSDPFPYLLSEPEGTVQFDLL